jgi:hypothetical protein
MGRALPLRDVRSWIAVATLVLMEEALVAALAPVLADVHRSALGVVLTPGEPETAPPGVSRTVLWASDGSGTGVQVHLGDAEAWRIAGLASAVQDIVVEDFLRTPWPRCPRHPRGGHPLLARVVDEEAVWTCPSDGWVICPVGRLAE